MQEQRHRLLGCKRWACCCVHRHLSTLQAHRISILVRQACWEIGDAKQLHHSLQATGDCDASQKGGICTAADSDVPCIAFIGGVTQSAVPAADCNAPCICFEKTHLCGCPCYAGRCCCCQTPQPRRQRPAQQQQVRSGSHQHNTNKHCHMSRNQ
jgi:hypothetical protein